MLRERYLAAGEADARDVLRRVADALAKAEQTDQQDGWADAFFAAQVAGFIPGGRINANAGLGGRATLINCFVQPCSLGGDGVDAAIGHALTTLALGGGVGYDFSSIAPSSTSGAPGPVETIRRFDRACGRLAESQCRRCAQMAVLRCDHPDILDFIHAKDQGGLGNFNMSVAVTDAFMRSVLADERIALTMPGRDWASASATASARAIWREMIHSAHRYGEPGMLFVDAINRDNNLGWCEQIGATNPCGEQPLPDFGACVLGSMNLTRFVLAPFSARARFDWAGFGRVVGVAVRMLDNVLSLTRWPLPQHKTEARAKRRIGLGMTGLADALLMMGLEYGSEIACSWTRSVARVLRNRAYLASVKLARERGAFELLKVDEYLAPGRFASRLPIGLQRAIRRWGIRNSHLLAIAPTGSISLAFADNGANGIEPVFAWCHVRRVRMRDGSSADFDVENFAWRLYRHLGGDVGRLPPWFVTAGTLPIHAHLKMLAAVAPFVDAGISKTVNLPPDTRVDEVEKLFVDAWRLGLKGLTCFPQGSALGAVLSLHGAPAD